MTINKYFPFFIGLLLFSSLQAQEISRSMFPVTNGSDQLMYGFAGGMEAPQFSPVDLNRDGTMDILLFDRAGHVAIPMIYRGPAGEVNYEIDWRTLEEFPDLNIWALMRDFNGDGVEDIFCATSIPGIQGIDVHRGRESDGRLRFERMSFDVGNFDVLQIEVGGNYSPLYSAWTDVPVIEDIDNDGDIDILTFEPGGSFLAYYKNLALEDGLGLDTLVYDWADPCWGKFRENDISEEVFLSDNPNECAKPEEPPVQPRHSGSTSAVYDMDNDGDMDLFLGDLASPSIKYLINGGDTEKAWITDQVAHFPENTAPVDIPYFVSPFILDIDGDGLEDFVATSNSDDFSENVEMVWYYRNRGEIGDADFRLEQRDLFIGEMLDFGTSSRPTVMDIDGDGLKDIIVGTGGYYDDGLRDPRLIYMRNTGTLEEPAFNIEDDDFLDFSELGSVPQWDFAPEAGDLDNDGDIDLIIGEFDGGLFFVENTAGPGQPADFATPVYPYMDIYVGAGSTPCIVDINYDGLNDLVVGERLGNNDFDGKCSNLNYFENVGERGAPEFISDPRESPNTACLGRVLFYPTSGIAEWSAPEIVLTNLGPRMMTGSSRGELMIYSNIAASDTEPFVLENESYGDIADGFRTVPELSDIDGDGYFEMIIGNFRGGLTAYQTDLVELVSSVTDPDLQATYQLFPNPTSDRVIIGGLTDERVMIYDMTGRLVLAPRANNAFDVSNLSPGVYTTSVFSDQGIWTERFVKVEQ